MKTKNFLLTMILSLVIVTGLSNVAKGQCSCPTGPCDAFPITVIDSLPSCPVTFMFIVDPCGWTGAAGDITIPNDDLPHTIPGGCISIGDCGPACIVGCFPAHYSLGWGAPWSAISNPGGTDLVYVDNTSAWALACCPNGVKYHLHYTSGGCPQLTITISCN